MSVNAMQNITEMVQAAWEPMTGLASAKGDKRFFLITKENNPDGSLMYMLVYASTKYTPKQIFTKLTFEPDSHPHFLVTSLPSGRAILSVHGSWREGLEPVSSKSFDLSVSTDKAKLKSDLVECAKDTIL